MKLNVAFISHCTALNSNLWHHCNFLHMQDVQNAAVAARDLLLVRSAVHWLSLAFLSCQVMHKPAYMHTANCCKSGVQ